jgi:hypothetical protein
MKPADRNAIGRALAAARHWDYVRVAGAGERAPRGRGAWPRAGRSLTPRRRGSAAVLGRVVRVDIAFIAADDGARRILHLFGDRGLRSPPREQ